MITIRQDMVTGWTQLLAESGNVKYRPIVVDLNPEELYDLVKEGENKLTWDIEVVVGPWNIHTFVKSDGFSMALSPNSIRDGRIPNLIIVKFK